MKKRDVELVVISDVHLGTYGCRAAELLNYLKSIRPKTLILNGDIIDVWQFSKSYFPDAHMRILRRILKFTTEGASVHYLTGNHDEVLRKFADFNIGRLSISNKLLLDLDGKKAWIFHGDVFDVTMQYSKWLAKLGAVGYDTLILINSFVNRILSLLGKEKLSFSKKIKSSFKNAVKFMNDFEKTAAELAIEKNYDYVVCGHIHQPEIKEIKNEKGSVMYLNSGDWVESLTALEYNKGIWEIYKYQSSDFPESPSKNSSHFDHENLDEKLDIGQLLKVL